MQILLASAKTMADTMPQYRGILPALTEPSFNKEASNLALAAGSLDTEALAKALGCSGKIALQNRQRLSDFFNRDSLLPAVLAYQGQAYKLLRATEMSEEDRLFAQQHLWITSFLYGLLRPMDAIHPYRMEGKVRLPGMEEKNIFAYWKPRLTDYIIRKVKDDDGILVHLATEEYQHLFDWRRIRENVHIVQPQYLVRKGDSYRLMAIHAKSFRGAMTRFIILNRIADESGLHAFSAGGILPEGRIVWDYGEDR